MSEGRLKPYTCPEADVSLFDTLLSILSQNDDIDGPTGLEVVENVQTLDSTSSEEVKAFVASTREIVAGIAELPVHHLLSFATPVSSVIFKRSVLLPFS